MKKLSNTDPVDTSRKVNVQKTSSERLMYVQFMSCVYWGGWFKKSVAYKKSVYIQLSQIFRLSVFYHYAFLRDKYVSRSFAITFKKNSHKKVLLYDRCLVEPQTSSMNLWTKTSSYQRLMTVKFCRDCGRGYCFTKLSETPFKVLTVKNVKLNVKTYIWT